MAGNPDIVNLGKATQFSKDNPPQNPGRKKGSLSISTILHDLMDMPLDVKNPITQAMEKMPIGKVIALQLAVKAAKGDIRAIEDILDRLEGKAVQFMVNAGVEKIEVEYVGFNNGADKGVESPQGNAGGDQRPAVEDNR